MGVRLTEVVLRDGLQDEPRTVPAADRCAVAEALVAAGVCHLEVASFVSARRVPQMAGAEQLLAMLPRHPGVTVAGLALSPAGVRRAAAAHAAGHLDELRLVVSASPSHSTANTGRGVDHALDLIGAATAALPGSLSVTACVATAFVCPEEGPLPPSRLLRVVRRLYALGAREISLADTVGTASPEHVARSLGAVLDAFPDLTVGLHLHDARGQALRTVDAALDLGVVRLDSSLGGLGGCPFVPGAPGNVATGDLVAHLHGRGIDTGVDEEALTEAARLLASVLAHAAPVAVGGPAGSADPAPAGLERETR